jgi:hypothetical protein
VRPSRSVRSPLAGKHFKNVKRASEHAKGPHCMRLTACLPNRTRAPSGERARTGTLDEPDREGNMAHTRAADDFQTIRARMEELRRESGGRGRYGNRLRTRRAGTSERQRDTRQSCPIA